MSEHDEFIAVDPKDLHALQAFSFELSSDKGASYMISLISCLLASISLCNGYDEESLLNSVLDASEVVSSAIEDGEIKLVSLSEGFDHKSKMN